MGFWAAIKIILKYLPELVSLVKWIGEKTNEGVSEVQLRNDIKAITKAFSPENTAQETAGDLNDIFKN